MNHAGVLNEYLDWLEKEYNSYETHIKEGLMGEEEAKRSRAIIGACYTQLMSISDSKLMVKLDDN